MQRFVPTLILFLLVLYGSARAGGPFSAYVQVYDENGNPLPGISLRLEVHTALGSGPEIPEFQFGSDTETTDSNGYAFLSVFPQGYLIRMDVFMTSYDYTVLSSQNTWTTTANTIFPQFHVGLDIDGNRVVDNWEMPLAQKFCPVLFQPKDDNGGH